MSQTNTFEDVENYFTEELPFIEAKSRSSLKESILDIIYSNDRGIYYVFGDSGVGKSRLIKSIKDDLKEEIFYLDNSPVNEREFLEEIYMQLRGKKFSQNVKIDEVRIRVNDAFKKINHTIIIDDLEEKELLNEVVESLEFLDGLKMLFIADKNFDDESIKNRFNSKIEINGITKDETFGFLKESMADRSFEKELSEILKSIDFIFETTKGNYGKIIEIISNAYKIVDFANSENIDKFKSLNECVIIMSALDRELVDGQE
jgi:RNase adaptor protein for sRNA GlmZ degradation